ncbi:Stp1/IreP family PP2C-type Ser/Thr phosphatase [Occallatibacter riparius]|uniref:Stp1/IreP family PP2C-type Ser/Thr phosphatase n=1 Tax=Occallatibacter riparius TaxID=1002689 RepID=A0A9J7BG46_9BACT|nr:Stp1/IreP family PP2C-type Ser/Thr phosphatase [Occallatibacter riparius]UWZ81727.1 Stp1/IreP family PP2C-type Ser/Thr phosphatase [Occallatibacter riparius]
MATAALHYAAAAASDRGRKRANNQDAFGFSIEHGVYVVCDGMGGAAGGEVASSIAVDEVLQALTERDREAQVPKLAEDAVCAANTAVYSRAQRNSNLSGMGTTLVALVVEQAQVWVVNVGDSRCYRLREGKLEQLTLDHSLVEEQVRLGRMTPHEALRSPLRNVITRAVGTQNGVTPDCFQFEAQTGDLFLLCSDGLTREVSDSAIQELLAGDQPLQERANRLIEAANKAGGRDNITCILVQAMGQ